MKPVEHQKIQQAIAAIRQERLSRNVKDNLIGNYKDFLREKENLKSHYNFNLAVFNSLVKLADELWDSKQRICRSKLLNTIKAYLQRGNDKLDNAAKANMFELIKKIFANGQVNDSISETCFTMLRNFTFSSDYEAWLCEQIKHYPSSTLLRRILNYPIASAVITNWVLENYTFSELRFKRYKSIAWLLNENPDYVVDEQTLLDDFEYLNTLDTARIHRFYFDHPQTFVDERYNQKYHFENLVTGFSSRPYCSIICRDVKVDEIPDFTELQRFFIENLAEIKNQTMLWAIASSKLPANTKNKLFKRHYSFSCFWTLLNIAKHYKLLSILDWLQKQNDPISIFREIELGKKIKLQ